LIACREDRALFARANGGGPLVSELVVEYDSTLTPERLAEVLRPQMADRFAVEVSGPRTRQLRVKKKWRAVGVSVNHHPDANETSVFVLPIFPSWWRAALLAPLQLFSIVPFEWERDIVDEIMFHLGPALQPLRIKR
jgi:hypothetical protein